MQLVADGPADLPGDQRRRAVAVHAVADVEVGFVKRERFNARGVAGEDFADVVRGLFVGVEAARQQGQVWAEPQGGGGRHGAAHAKFARRVVGGADHAPPLAAAADGQRNVAQGRIIPHLNGGKKAVHIDVNDFAHTRPSANNWISIQQIN